MDDRENVKLNSEKQNKYNSKCADNHWVLWMCIGVSLGISLGVVFNNIGLGFLIGASVGICLGMIINKKK